eukprot:CAMPEP_0115827538 /NCGR_PEP_ID=MMETSP0287-20121206/97_1 /TAXON_ID=412157 /ORGANISM="Chrysochromulina rotalis, Strain UIO044" /LENGTH=107 /DNA_ID=CAMNT_0003280701 /DNA_START=359 /DNA_END=679 /DNA_ORIENTATION=+
MSVEPKQQQARAVPACRRKRARLANHWFAGCSHTLLGARRRTAAALGIVEDVGPSARAACAGMPAPCCVLAARSGPQQQRAERRAAIRFGAEANFLRARALSRAASR